MKHKAIVVVDINKVQRDDLLKRFESIIPNSNGLYRVVLNCTETQQLTLLRHLLESLISVTLPVTLPPVPVQPVIIEGTPPFNQT